MDPSELLDIFIHDYLVKRGFSNTAELFRNEAQIIREIPPEFDQRPHGILYDVWSYRGSSSQSQAPNVAAIMDTTPQIIREGYSIQHLTRFQSDQTLLYCDISSGGKIVASGGMGMKPFVCYIETRDSVTTSEAHSSYILDVRFQAGSTIFATSSTDKTVKLWDANIPVRLLSTFDGHNGPCVIASSKEGGSKVRFQPVSGMLLAVAKRNVITILDYQSMGVMYRLQGHTKNIYSLCWNSTGQTIASVSEDAVRVWSLSLGGQCIYEYPSEENKLMSTVFHPRHRNVLVVGGYKWMELLILENGKIRCISAFSRRVSVPGLAACTANESIATTHDSVVNIWK
ncbi:transcriptional corepressor LEUNIG [Trifolium repens]|nr:transcriptional corepressor LEUNIG [Trifolium repens]